MAGRHGELQVRDAEPFREAAFRGDATQADAGPARLPETAAVSTRHATSAGERPQTANVTYTTGSPEGLAESRRSDAEVRDDVKMALDGKPGIARKRLEDELLLRNHSENVAVPLMDVEMANGDFASAYKVAVPYVKQGQPTNQLLLRASLAAAKCGEVYEGQRDFLVKHLVDIYAPSEVLPWLPSGESADAIATLSAYSIALEVGTRRRDGRALPFYEMARSSDPTNPLFCSGAAACLAEKYRYTEAITVLASAYARSRGGMHDEIRASIWYDREALRKVGEGHPLYPPPVQSGTGAGPTTIKP